jgi:hypothetical protein
MVSERVEKRSSPRRSIRRTPAMAAGISNQIWTCKEIADLLDGAAEGQIR